MKHISITAILAVALGGALGATLRYLLVIFTQRSSGFPIATLFANLLGSFILGLIVSITIETKMFSETYRLFLAVGFAGALTTFSTFSLETIQLWQASNYLAAVFNILLNLSLTSLALLFAMWLARFIL